MSQSDELLTLTKKQPSQHLLVQSKHRNTRNRWEISSVSILTLSKWILVGKGYLGPYQSSVMVLFREKRRWTLPSYERKQEQDMYMLVLLTSFFVNFRKKASSCIFDKVRNTFLKRLLNICQVLRYLFKCRKNKIRDFVLVNLLLKLNMYRLQRN